MSAVPTDPLITAGDKTYCWIFVNLHFSNVKYLAEYSAGKRFKIELAVQGNCANMLDPVLDVCCSDWFIEHCGTKTYCWIFVNLHFSNVKHLAEYNSALWLKIELADLRKRANMLDSVTDVCCSNWFIEHYGREIYWWIFTNLHYSNVKYLAEYNAAKWFKIEFAVQWNWANMLDSVSDVCCSNWFIEHCWRKTYSWIFVTLHFSNVKYLAEYNVVKESKSN